jgi:hypothetical protein
MLYKLTIGGGFGKSIYFDNPDAPREIVDTLRELSKIKSTVKLNNKEIYTTSLKICGESIYITPNMESSVTIEEIKVLSSADVELLSKETFVIPAKEVMEKLKQ